MYDASELSGEVDDDSRVGEARWHRLNSKETPQLLSPRDNNKKERSKSRNDQKLIAKQRGQGSYSDEPDHSNVRGNSPSSHQFHPV